MAWNHKPTPLGVIDTLVSHNHFCKHCELSWSCTSCNDPDEYDVRQHGCEPQRQYRIRMAILMGLPNRKCQYGCSRPCDHPRIERKLSRCKTGECGECKRGMWLLSQER